MSSSSDKFTQSRKTQKQMFLLVPSGHLCAPRRDINMMSPYKALSIWVKRFSEYLAYKLCHRPDSWRGFLHIYLLSFPRFWTFCIDWFAFLRLIAWQWKHTILVWPWGTNPRTSTLQSSALPTPWVVPCELHLTFSLKAGFLYRIGAVQICHYKETGHHLMSFESAG